MSEYVKVKVTCTFTKTLKREDWITDEDRDDLDEDQDDGDIELDDETVRERYEEALGDGTLDLAGESDTPDSTIEVTLA